MVEEPINKAVGALAQQLEAALTAILDEHAPGWTLIDLRNRCCWIRTPNSPAEILTLDGRPVLELHPIEAHEHMTLEGKVVINFRQRIRRIPPEGVAA
jgi:hypothetical protein